MVRLFRPASEQPTSLFERGSGAERLTLKSKAYPERYASDGAPLFA